MNTANPIKPLNIMNTKNTFSKLNTIKVEKASSIGMTYSQYGLEQTPGVHHLRPKRAQVKVACVNCQKACKKCDEGRPCQRCIKYNLTDTCVNSARKERKSGIKRGPYRRREAKDTSGGPPLKGTKRSISSDNGASKFAVQNLVNQDNSYLQSVYGRGYAPINAKHYNKFQSDGPINMSEPRQRTRDNFPSKAPLSLLSDLATNVEGSKKGTQKAMSELPESVYRGFQNIDIYSSVETSRDIQHPSIEYTGNYYYSDNMQYKHSFTNSELTHLTNRSSVGNIPELPGDATPDSFLHSFNSYKRSIMPHTNNLVTTPFPASLLEPGYYRSSRSVGHDPNAIKSQTKDQKDLSLERSSVVYKSRWTNVQDLDDSYLLNDSMQREYGPDAKAYLHKPDEKTPLNYPYRLQQQQPNIMEHTANITKSESHQCYMGSVVDYQYKDNTLKAQSYAELYKHSYSRRSHDNVHLETPENFSLKSARTRTARVKSEEIQENKSLVDLRLRPVSRVNSERIENLSLPPIKTFLSELQTK